MKKIYSLFALMGALAFTGCEPTEDDYNNNISFMTADQIKATITVEQQNGRNVNKVKVVANNGVPIQITNGVNTAYSSYAELLLFNEGVNTVYVLAQNPDGSVLTKEYEVNVEQMYYEVPEQYAILTGGTSKTWTWDTEVNGGAWGNLGYKVHRAKILLKMEEVPGGHVRQLTFLDRCNTQVRVHQPVKRM